MIENSKEVEDERLYEVWIQEHDQLQPQKNLVCME